ncbi:phosphate metabolism protein-domain-containing protein [Irpex lacteus]|nr:phosphate metabolism protein-domain-containing protein [Irpex lacteus]
MSIAITQNLPMSLATKNLQERWERQRKLSGQPSRNDEEDMDLFSRDRFKLALRRRIQAPVEKAVKDVQKDMARVAKINPDLKTVDTDIDDPVKEMAKAPHIPEPSASTSAREMNDGLSHEQLQQTRTSSHKSRKRKGSESSSSSSASSNDDQQPPQFAPAAKREGEDGDEFDQDFDIHGFDHPSTYEPQPWIWIPKDELGVSEWLVKELRDGGVEASDEGSTMDRKGNVEVQRNPPDEDWAGGHDA